MNPYKINLFVYAESEAEAKKLEKSLFDFVCSKREQGIAVSASRLYSAVEKFKNNIIVNNYLKQ